MASSPTRTCSQSQTLAANAANLDTLALAAYNSGDFSFAANDVVYIPTAWPENAGEPQIFMVEPPPAATPEPSGLILLGTGLLGTVGFLRRKLLRTQVF